LDSSKQVLSSSSPTSSQPTPEVPLAAAHISQEAYVTDTSRQSAHGVEPITAEQVAPASTKHKGGPINAIRNFFARLFNSSSQRHEERQKSNSQASTNPVVQTTETTTTLTTATVATSNPPTLS
jgi:hypothetical protein